MRKLTIDYIAIDTNVFVHLFNPQENTCLHISKLLKKLYKNDISLLVDSEERIKGEYATIIRELFESNTESGNSLQILQQWFESEYHFDIKKQKEIKLDSGDQLMNTIKKIIPEKNTDVTDRIFVYVAFKAGRPLISNDKGHIVTGHKKNDPRRAQLKKKIKAIRPRLHKKRKCDKSRVLTSCEAYRDIKNCN